VTEIQEIHAGLLSCIDRLVEYRVRQAIGGMKTNASELRTRKGFTVEELAGRAGVSEATIYRLESGCDTRNQKVQKSISKLAAALGCRPDEYAKAVRAAKN